MKGILAVLILAGAIAILLWMIQSKPGETIQKQVESFSTVKAKTTRINMLTLQREIISYLSSYGKIPEDLQQMISARALFTEVNDAWGNPIDYDRISDMSFKLVSAGGDREFNTTDDIVLEY